MESKLPSELTRNISDLNISNANDHVSLSSTTDMNLVISGEPVLLESTAVVGVMSPTNNIEPINNVTVKFGEAKDLLININHEIKLPRTNSPTNSLVESSAGLNTPPTKSDLIKVEEKFNIGSNQVIKGNFILSKPKAAEEQKLIHNIAAQISSEGSETKLDDKLFGSSDVYEATIPNEGYLEFSYHCKPQDLKSMEENKPSDHSQALALIGKFGSTTSLGGNEGTLTEDATMYIHHPINSGKPNSIAKEKNHSSDPNMTLLESLIVTANMMRSYLHLQEDSHPLQICREFVSYVDGIVQENSLNPQPLDLPTSEGLLRALEMAMSQFNDQDLTLSSAQLDVKILQD